MKEIHIQQLQQFKVPCEECLILPICKERLRTIEESNNHRLRGYAGWYILRELCSMVNDYIKESGYQSTWNEELNQEILGKLEEDLTRIYGNIYIPSIEFDYYKISKRRI